MASEPKATNYRFSFLSLATWRQTVARMLPTLVAFRRDYANAASSKRRKDFLEGSSITWDLSQVPQGKLRLSALVFLLSQMQLVHHHFALRQTLIMPKSAKLRELIFWSGLPQILKEYKMVEPISDEVWGDISTKPSSQRFRIAYFPFPEALSDPNDLAKSKREELKRETHHYAWNSFMQYLPYAFSSGRNLQTGFPENEDLRREVYGAVGELIANSWLWGRASCFVGVQPTATDVGGVWRSVFSISDSGIGFLRALKKSADYGRLFSEVVDATNEYEDFLSFLGAFYANPGKDGMYRTLEVAKKYRGQIWCAYGQQVAQIDSEIAEQLITRDRKSYLTKISRALKHGDLVDVRSTASGANPYDPLPVRISGVHLELEVYHSLSDHLYHR